MRICAFTVGVRVRVPLRQLLNEVLSLKSTFYSCSPATVASNLRALSVLCTCAQAHPCTCGDGGWNKVGGHAKTSTDTSGSAILGDLFGLSGEEEATAGSTEQMNRDGDLTHSAGPSLLARMSSGGSEQ